MTQRSCSKCGAPLAADTVLCVKCGTHQTSGLSAHTIVKVRQAGRAGRALAFAGVVAAFAGVVWAGLAIFLRVEIGYVAVGVGLLTGATVMFLTNERSFKTGLAAAGLAAFGLLVGKAIVFQFGIVRFVTESVRKDDKALREQYVMETSMRKVIERAAQLPGDEKADKEETRKFVAEASEQAASDYAALSSAAKDELAHRFAHDAVADAGLGVRLGVIFGLHDILWLALALGSAFKLASGRSDSAD